jgi:cupin 2 domain-containing protein
MCRQYGGLGCSHDAPEGRKYLWRCRERGKPGGISCFARKRYVKIERIVSRSHSSPPGFWYDPTEDEWAMVVRGTAALEFAAGEIVEMQEGDYVIIPRGVRHRVACTSANTVWLAVHLK